MRVGRGLPVLLVILGSVAPAPAQVGETALPGDVASRLDTFEAQRLTKANQTFAATVASRTDDKILAWRQAYAEYEAFLTEFSRSPVVPFVLLRKGRCKQEENKIFAAIAHYEEVLDYFPNEIEYAAPALYRIGECHWGKGDIVKAMKAWAEMANDKDYSKHRLAAYAVNRLADNLMKQDKVIEAVKY